MVGPEKIKYKIFSIFLSYWADPTDYTQVQSSLELSTFSFFRRPGLSPAIFAAFISHNEMLSGPSPSSLVWSGSTFLCLIFLINISNISNSPAPPSTSFPPASILHLSDVWRGRERGRGREGKFSRTLNIFFFIHCTGLCLYRILIAREKTIPSLRCKNNIFNEKIPFLWDKFFLMCEDIKQYWSDCFWSINQNSTCKKCKINISKIRRGEKSEPAHQPKGQPASL